MPPRKSDASKTFTGEENITSKDVTNGVNIEDLSLPKSIVTRLAKGVLPPNTQIQGNAMLAINKSATVFANCLASHAIEHVHAQNRKTLGANDVFIALEEMEFDDFLPRLKAELAVYEEIQDERRKNAGKSKATSAEKDAASNGMPASKKARLVLANVGKASAAPEKQPDDEFADADADETDVEGEEEGEEEEKEEEELSAEEREEKEEDDEVEVEEHDVPKDEALDNGEDSS